MSESDQSSSSSSANQKTERKNDKNKNQKPQTIDPELDIKSEQFNPLKALYAPSVQMPMENIPLYNNLAHFEATMKMQQQQQQQQHHTSGDKSSVRAAPKMPTKSYRQSVELHQRRFLPHQEMVKGKGKNARQTRNLLLKMNSDKLMGPSSVLKEWKVQRKRIKIFTRNVTTINGYVTGFIEAFDKHWNIVLSSVYEVWKRKKFHYCPKAVMQSSRPPSLQRSNDDATATAAAVAVAVAVTANNNDGNSDNRYDDKLYTECMQRLKMLNIAPPTVAVKSLNRKLVECSRNVPKLLIRGEQIATIILDQQTTAKPETEINSISVKV